MKKTTIIFHPKYFEVYASDPAAAQGRLDGAYKLLQTKGYEFIEPEIAQEDDILLVHTKAHFERIASKSSHLLTLSLLSAGGAICASEMAMSGTFSFGLIRPPGHHASADSCWGFCFFNNIAVAIKKLLNENKIKNALIVDFDLHFGDGTNGIFLNEDRVVYHHMDSITSLENFLNSTDNVDIVGVSAGFDRYINDWGGLLTLEDYKRLGEILGMFASHHANGRIFSVLEGGYNHRELGDCIYSYLTGLEQAIN